MSDEPFAFEVTTHAQERLLERFGLVWDERQWAEALAPHAEAVEAMNPTTHAVLPIGRHIYATIWRCHDRGRVSTVLREGWHVKGHVKAKAKIVERRRRQRGPGRT